MRTSALHQTDKGHTQQYFKVDDVDESLLQFRSLLVPGGKYYYYEHVAAPDGYESVFMMMIHIIHSNSFAAS